VTAPHAKAGIVGVDVYKELAQSPFFLQFGADPTQDLIVEDFEGVVTLGSEDTMGNFVAGDTVNGVIFLGGAAPIGPGTLGGLIDSVDFDDGEFGLSLGYSLLEGDGSLQIKFSEVELGFLPTHVGIVVTDWTVDLNELSDVTLSAAQTIGDVSTGTFVDSVTGGIADNASVSNIGGNTVTIFGVDHMTLEDIFLGVSNAGGIESIVVTNNSILSNAGIEIDHLQFGYFPGAFPGAGVPEPSSWALFGCVGCLVAGRLRRRRANRLFA